MEAEGLAFQSRVREGYLRAAELEPWRVVVVDANGTPEQVFSRLVDTLSGVIPELADLDAQAFLAMQADVERAMADITLSLGQEETNV